MPITTYKGGKYRLLAGKKIFHNGEWITLPYNAKMFIEGEWYPLGRTIPTSSIPTPPDINHYNVEEPTGVKWYISPAGSGTQDGTSWENSAPNNMIHVILLQSSPGDSVYFLEGTYTTDRPVELPPADIQLFGGFKESDPTWETRNWFEHPTIFKNETANFTCIVNKVYPVTQGAPSLTIDGISIQGYSSAISCDNTHGSAIGGIRNGSFTSGIHVQTVSNCIIYAGIRASTVSDTYVAPKAACNINITTASNMYINAGAFGNVSIDLYLNTATNCTLIGGTLTGSLLRTATNCIVRDCVLIPENVILGKAQSCVLSNVVITATNISSIPIVFDYRGGTDCVLENISLLNISELQLIETTTSANPLLTDSKIINCAGKLSIGRSIQNCMFINCSYIHLKAVSSSNILQSNVFINCSLSRYLSSTYYAFNASNVLVINCSLNTSNLFDMTYCTIVNSSSYTSTNNQGAGSNNLLWNTLNISCSPSYGDYLAQSDYYTNNTLTLGYDNTVARFTNTGYYPAQGVQDVGECPSPVDDPDGFAAYVEAFGDWHPLSDSLLIGKGKKVTSVYVNNKDLDGVTRPDPPTIGAYEPKPEEK